MSVVYEVSLEVDPDLAAEFARWLPGHVDRVAALPGFHGATIEKVEREPGRPPAWCVRYRLDDRATLQRYFDEYAAGMRREGLDAFGDAFNASRRILKPQ